MSSIFGILAKSQLSGIKSQIENGAMTNPGSNDGSIKTCVITGDSITAMNGSGTTSIATLPNGYIDFGNMFLNHMLKIVKNDAISGDRTDNIASRLATNVLPLKSDIVHILAGTNDIIQNVSVNTITANLQTMYQAVLNNRSMLAVATIPPSASSGSWFSTATQRNNLAIVNSWIRKFARNNKNVILVDYYNCCIDSVTGVLKTNYSTDGLHPNTAMAYAMGVAFSNAVKNYVKPIEYRNSFANDYDNYLNNPSFQGTTTPTSWTVTGTNSPTLIANSGFENYNTLSVDITSGNYLEIKQTYNASSKWQTGDNIYATLDVEFVNVTELSQMYLSIEIYNASFGIDDKSGEFGTTVYTAFTPDNRKFTMVTPVSTVAATSSTVVFDFKIKATGTVKISRPCIVNAKQ